MGNTFRVLENVCHFLQEDTVLPFNLSVPLYKKFINLDVSNLGWL